MTVAMSTPAYIVTAAALFLVALAVRLIGFWLIRKGGAMERARHGVLPGVGSAPRRPDRVDEPPEKAPRERYDPFNNEGLANPLAKRLDGDAGRS